MITSPTCPSSIINSCHHWLTVKITPATRPSPASGTCQTMLFTTVRVICIQADMTKNVIFTCDHYFEYKLHICVEPRLMIGSLVE